MAESANGEHDCFKGASVAADSVGHRFGGGMKAIVAEIFKLSSRCSFESNNRCQIALFNCYV